MFLLEELIYFRAITIVALLHHKRLLGL